MNPLDLFNRIHRLPPEALTLVEQAVLLAVCSTVDGRNDFTGWATQSQLAAWAKVTDRSVRNALASLVAKGMISHRPGAHRGHDVTVNVSAIVAYVEQPTRNHVPTPRNHVPANPEPRSCQPGTTFRLNPEPRSDTAVSSAVLSASHTATTAPASAGLHPTPEADHEPDAAPDTGPTADSRNDGGDRHADPSSQAPAHADPANGAGDPVSSARGAGPAVAAWEVIDDIRRRNVKGAGRLTMTAAMSKAMNERLREHTADDLALMVEWVTGCRCGGPKCRACSWLQPKGYTHPKTYLRPDNCSEYLDLARQAESAAIVPIPAPANPMDHHRRLVAILCSRDDRRMIEGDDDRHTLALRYAVKLCGGRDAFRADPSAVAARWPEVWAAAEAEVVAKLAAMGQP